VSERGTVFHHQHAASLDGFGRDVQDASGSSENCQLMSALANVLANKFYIADGSRVDLVDHHPLGASQIGLSGIVTQLVSGPVNLHRHNPARE